MSFKLSFRTVLVLIAVISIGTSLWAEDVRVDRDELASIGDQSIKFINYVGPYEFTNTLDQIRGIGRSLGSQLKPSVSGEANTGGKYRVLHIVSPEITAGLDGDIFIIESDAAVDHINNLRTIVAGYLETTYGFSGRDSYLIAEFVTYYNAVYRNNMEMAKGRYKLPVVKALVPEKMGLDTHYSNWAGKTQMLIPLRLSGVPGGKAPVVDTGAISDAQVIDKMRQEDDMGLESRRDLVELREKEIDKDQKELDQKQAAVEDREETAAKELEKLEKKEDAGIKLSPEEEKRKEELEKEKDAAEKEQTSVKEEQKEIDQRTDEVLEMRDDIAEDENLRMEEKKAAQMFTSAAQVSPVWFLMVDQSGDGIPYGRVVKYNLIDGKRLAVSKVTAVRGRTLAVLPQSLLVIAGKEGGNSKVRLMLLDRGTLDTVKEGNNDVFPGSLMTVKGSDIYLVTSENGEWRLGKFNTSLERTAVSEVAVEPWTSISFDGASLLVQAGNGKILKLSASTLKEEARLE